MSDTSDASSPRLGINKAHFGTLAFSALPIEFPLIRSPTPYSIERREYKIRLPLGLDALPPRATIGTRQNGANRCAWRIW